MPLKKRVNINVPAMTKISMDIKHMPTSHGYSYILVLLCKLSNYMVELATLTYLQGPPHILPVFQKGYVAYFGPPKHMKLCVIRMRERTDFAECTPKEYHTYEVCPK